MFKGFGDEENAPIAFTAGRPRILLVDDDVTFGKIMKKMAERLELPLQYCSSVNELAALSKPNYDIGIFDYDLGTVTGLQLSDIVERYLGKIPVLLVSSYARIEPKKWPDSVKGFVPKSKGFYAILSEACRVFQEKNQNTPTLSSAVTP